MHKIFLWAPAMVLLLIVSGCNPEPTTSVEGLAPDMWLITDEDNGVHLANPASVYCAESGGRIVTREQPNQGEYGVCVFEDGRECEEWALMRGTCRMGGMAVARYNTEAARFCVITGGTYEGDDTRGRQATCTLPSGEVCAAGAYYIGRCP